MNSKVHHLFLKFFLYLNLLLVFVSDLCPSGYDLQETVHSNLVNNIEDFRKRHNLASISFSFFQGHNYNFDYASGHADISEKIEATPDHIYTIASVTKSITAMTLIDLVHQNYINLGDSVDKLITGFPHGVTVQDLLNHTSGFLREKENERYLSNSDYTDVVKYLPVKFNLKIHRYANFNYAALGAIIENVTQKKFSKVAKEYFYSATGDSLYFSNQSKNPSDSRFVKNYVKRGRRRHLHEPVNFGLWQPAALAQTTAKSLAKFLRHHMTPQFIQFIESHAVVIKTRRHSKDYEIKECYALGFRLRYINGQLEYIYHDGFLYGVLSTMYYFPAKDAGFVALANMSNYPNQAFGLGSFYNSVEEVFDAEFNKDIALYTIANGFTSGIIYYEQNRRNGQLIESLVNDYADSCVKKQEYENAINLYKLNNYAFPESGATYRNLANAYLSVGEDELAEETLTRGLMVDPGLKTSINTLKKTDAASTF